MNIQQARDSAYCPGCNKFKDPQSQLIVCWECFKYRTDVIPFKYAGMSLDDWVKMVKESQIQTLSA